MPIIKRVFRRRSISLVKKYVESHVRTASLEDAADYVNMNAQYLSRLYKKKSGQNFSDYVMEVKMKESQRLLKDSRYRIDPARIFLTGSLLLPEDPPVSS